LTAALFNYIKRDSNQADRNNGCGQQAAALSIRRALDGLKFRRTRLLVDPST